MNKIQDGWFSASDSYKPLFVSTDMRHCAAVSFVGDQVIVRPHGDHLEIRQIEGEEGAIAFRIVPKGPATSEALSDLAASDAEAGLV